MLARLSGHAPGGGVGDNVESALGQMSPRVPPETTFWTRFSLRAKSLPSYAHPISPMLRSPHSPRKRPPGGREEHTPKSPRREAVDDPGDKKPKNEDVGATPASQASTLRSPGTRAPAHQMRATHCNDAVYPNPDAQVAARALSNHASRDPPIMSDLIADLRVLGLHLPDFARERPACLTAWWYV